MAHKASAFVAALKLVGASESLAQVTSVHASAILAETGRAVVVDLAAAAKHALGSLVVVADIAQRNNILAAHARGTGIASRITRLRAKACARLVTPHDAGIGRALAISSA